ncbi:hypothetical protein L1987_06433 [Smallanthus sonchifolius]|uniref:Uncharacterized protein n=2 Tax=Smallanthus sonchifolius TaxID=185202 RepID=A0ACB9JUH4_9ASTR|nr:hypothetical protein L1987_05003 [Smallanthus sonchifolius]KAI3824960.1 hypothetical protein L1987_06433 [Smallanthus sonchifolius]
MRVDSYASSLGLPVRIRRNREMGESDIKPNREVELGITLMVCFSSTFFSSLHRRRSSLLSGSMSSSVAGVCCFSQVSDLVL